MLLLALAVLFFIIYIIYIDTEGVSISLVLSLLFCVPLLGIFAYPESLAEREKVLSMKEEIKTVREAYYKSQDIKDVIVKGSLDNISQSTILSKYISEYAVIKSNFNKNLVWKQEINRMTVTRMLWTGMFIDKRIHNIERIN